LPQHPCLPNQRCVDRTDLDILIHRLLLTNSCPDGRPVPISFPRLDLLRSSINTVCKILCQLSYSSKLSSSVDAAQRKRVHACVPYHTCTRAPHVMCLTSLPPPPPPSLCVQCFTPQLFCALYPRGGATHDSAIFFVVLQREIKHHQK